MKQETSILRFALQGLALAALVALVIVSFRAYQDPSVVLPILNTFTMCG